MRLFFFLAFLSGVIIGDIWFQAGAGIIVLLSGICCLYFWRRWWILGIMIFALFGGYTLAYLSLYQAEENRENIGNLVAWEGHDRNISGTAGELLSVAEFSHKYRMTVLEIDRKLVKPFDISLSLAPNLSLTPGDRVVALGRFSFPRDTQDYMGEKQLWYRGMIAEFRTFHIEKTPPESYGIFVRMRFWFDRKLSEIFPPIGHDILSGIILGQKTNLSPELRENLKASGLMHIMVVSGSNVMMLIIFLSLFLRSFLPWIRITLISVTILGFVILVGGDTPVWRAALMGIIGYSVSLWGYRFSSLFLPIGVALILGIFNPLSLAYDIGLQLSFLSVICIIVFGKKLTRFFGFLGPFFDEAMSLTVAATIGTFPITLFYFGTFSLIGPIANLFAAPAIPLLMYGGILTLLVSTFSDTLAYFIGYIPWIAVTYLTKIITFFGSHSRSLITIELGQYREDFIIMSLLLLTIFIVHYSRKNKQSI